MTIRAEHELHGRRRGRNLGIGLMLGAFVILVMAMTFVKVRNISFNQAPIGTSANSTVLEGGKK